jgi:hypothetical protein
VYILKVRSWAICTVLAFGFEWRLRGVGVIHSLITAGVVAFVLIGLLRRDPSRQPELVPNAPMPDTVRSQSAAGKGQSLWDSISTIGWFTTMYLGVVGAPSILEIAQAVFKPWRLTPAFQWIVDGYHQLTAVVASYVEPFFVPAIARINSVLDWHLVLDPIWRPVFLLMSIIAVAAARTSWIRRERPLVVRFRTSVINLIGSVPIALAVAMVVGLRDRSGALPAATLLSTAAVVFAYGLFALWLSLRSADPFWRLVGLNTIGGFLTAAMIVGADQLVKWLGS